MLRESQNRLNRIVPGLNARERAQAVIQAWKEDRPHDSRLRALMPPEQGPEVLRRLEDARLLNAQVAWMLSLHEAHIAHYWSQVGWLASLHRS